MKTAGLCLLALLGAFTSHAAADEQDMQEVFIDIEVENAFNRGLAVLRGPLCAMCSNEQRTNIYDFLVEERDRHRQRLRAADFGSPDFGRQSAPSLASVSFSIPEPPCGPDGSPNMCSIKAALCNTALIEAHTVCSDRARNDHDHVGCERLATARHEHCLTQSAEAKSSTERIASCRTQYAVERAGCLDTYNQAYGSCSDAEQERYDECMGACAG